MVEFPHPLDQEEGRYIRAYKRYAEPRGGEPYVDRDPQYHFCHCKLVQPTGRRGSVPLPKWEVVKSFLELEEKWYNRVPLPYDACPLSEFQPGDFFDAYGDSYLVDDADDDNWIDLVKIPNYKKQWRDFFWRVKQSPRKLRKDIRALPYKHAISDRRVQLRQIRFLFPETRIMPLNIALDWVRDRM